MEFTFVMTDKPRLEEQALSQAVELGIASQLDEAESLDVDIRSDLKKMAQGRADSVSVQGKGLVMQKELRVQEMQVHTDQLAVNLLSALLGQVQLEQPVDTTVRIVMTEADINQALNSDYIRTNMSPLELNVEGKVVPVKLQPPLSVHLPGDGKMSFTGSLRLPETEVNRQVGFTGVILPRKNEQPLLLEGFQCTPGKGLSLEFLIALMQKFQELLNLPYIEWSGIALRIQELDVQVGSLTLVAEAHVHQVPSS